MLNNTNDPYLTNKEIRITEHLQLGITRIGMSILEKCSIHTIHAHCSNIFRKFGVNNVTSLLKMLRERDKEKEKNDDAV